MSASTTGGDRDEAEQAGADQPATTDELDTEAAAGLNAADLMGERRAAQGGDTRFE